MFSPVKQFKSLSPRLQFAAYQLRYARTDAGPNRRRSKSPAFTAKKTDQKSEWWIVDGEMHEIGDHVPPRERFVIPRDNVPNRRRKQLREQFMRRTRLVLKESEHEPWCKRYMELYEELRENWERLYWDEGYSKKIAQDHANYESAEDDDKDFNPYRSKRFEEMKDQGFGRNKQGDTWEKVNQIRDKFEYDREKRMAEKAFAPMNRGIPSELPNPNFRNQPFDTQRYFADERD
ncbi:hypothetical protein P3X46_017980 [Hevea brasiliensis]|uniref:Cathepsin propeptide inhibitor domain-containing protein n=1 Tax=Hevea brasiliensis TaxID=3981 RepID=A0ABQ9LPD0_HEVBR|nr:uncharacterized protein LOC110647954 [Hevea brasiliensis]KAJ9169831.1 hypothetical protein P3X46_017980 [Hevea brasiliensis]